MYILDGIPLDGYPELSPFGLADGQSVGMGAKRQQFSDSIDANGAALQKESTQDNAVRTIPLEVYSRFTSTYTNIVTNPRPASTTNWSAIGTVGSGPTVDTTNFKIGANSIKVVTNGNANTGIGVSFTGTVAAYSGSIYVNAPSGAPMAVLFDGAASTAFTGTGDWQQVKTENITLTAATRKLEVIQTDAGTRTFQVNAACVTQTTTATRYFDGTVGDGVWTGAADASTSTTLTGEYGIAKAVGTLANLTKKAEKYADRDPAGIPLTIIGPQLPFIMRADCVSADLHDFPLDISHYRGLATGTLVCTCLPLAYGPEYTVGTASKAIGTGALEMTLTGVKGDEPCPCRVQISDSSPKDFRFVCMGIQGREYVSGTSLVLSASSLSVSGYSGTLTAATTDVQTLTKTGTISGGTFTLTYDGVTTTALNWNDNAATVQTALQALTTIGSGNVTVTGGPISTTTLTFTFASALASKAIAQMTVTSSLTGGGTVAMATTTDGFPAYVSAGLYSSSTTLADTGALSHIGSYRVWARVYDNAATTDLYKSNIRLTWGTGDLASVTTNNYATPAAVGDFSLIDLGQIHIPAVATGTQQWKGRIEGYTSGTAGNTLRIIDLNFVPIETGAGEVRTVNSTATSLVAFDDYTQTAGNLSTKSANLGGAYAGSGDASDDHIVDATNHYLTRTGVSDAAAVGRYNLLSVNHTDVDMSLDVGYSVVPSFGAPLTAVTTSTPINGYVVRYVDANNYAIVALRPTYGNSLSGIIDYYVDLIKCVGGSRVQLLDFHAWTTVGTLGYSRFPLRCTISSAGAWTVRFNGVSMGSGTDSVFATGGALANGVKLGPYDEYQSAGAATRVYDNLTASAASASTPAIYNGQDLQFRSNGDVLRAASGGSIYSVPSRATVAMPPQLTPTVNEGLTNRLLILASRNNPDLASDPVSDKFDATVYATPVYRVARWES